MDLTHLRFINRMEEVMTDLEKEKIEIEAFKKI